ncbi:MAG TPA: hypothetical protein VHG32_13400 [Thermoanaerobaculia bacterium]|nr:hypothetical protein [Thermoanaerobaculia bacterium]
MQDLDFPMPLRDLAKKPGCWLGGYLFEGLLDALCEWLVRSLAALVAALLSGLLGVACRHGTATPLRHLLPAAASAACGAQPNHHQGAAPLPTPARKPTSSH